MSLRSFHNPSDAEIHDILAQPMTIAVVGCSPDPGRDSNRIARILQRKGHRVIPVNPTVHDVLGTRSYPSLAAVPERLDMADVFRRPDAVPAIVDDAIAAHVRVLWLQLGVVHEKAAARAREAGITVVMDRCPAIEYRRLFPDDDD